MDAQTTNIMPSSSTATKCSTCSTCKHWRAQGVIGLRKTSTGDSRVCMADLFGDMDNPDFRPMPEWVTTFRSAKYSKGQLNTHKDFGCINHNATFDEY